jgi:spore germination protein GerM
MFIVTLLLFVINWNKIQETIKSTGFSDAVKLPGLKDPGGKPAGTPAPGSSDGSQSPGIETPSASPGGTTTGTAVPEGKPGAAKPAEQPDAVAVKPADPGTKPPPTTKPVTPMEQVKSTRVATLYFIRVDDDGTISRHDVQRTVSVSDSPMTDALEALMAGPDADEISRGFISLIPAGTRLLSAQVRGSTAYLNFNDAFMYNRYGIEGYAGQLKQIVYTATVYPTVKDVQILIDGQKREYLGGDGVYIGKPLSRASF